MKKAVELKLKLWIEGEDQPAHDFAASSIQAVRDIMAAGESKHPELQITIKEIAEDTEDED